MFPRFSATPRGGIFLADFICQRPVIILQLTLSDDSGFQSYFSYLGRLTPNYSLYSMLSVVVDLFLIIFQFQVRGLRF